MVDPVDQVAGDGIGDGINHLAQNVLWPDQLDDRSLLAGPEGLPTPAQGVLMLGEELVEHLKEVRQLSSAIDDDAMDMIAGRTDADDPDT